MSTLVIDNLEGKVVEIKSKQKWRGSVSFTDSRVTVTVEPHEKLYTLEEVKKLAYATSIALHLNSLDYIRNKKVNKSCYPLNPNKKDTDDHIDYLLK